MTSSAASVYLHRCVSPLLLLLLVICAVIGTAQSQAADVGVGDYYGAQYYDDGESQRPQFRRTPQNYTVAPGDRAVLKCRIEHLGTKTVTWRKEGDAHPLTIGLYTFVNDKRITVDFAQRLNEWSLIIENVKPQDEGFYHCTVITKHDHGNTYEIQLNVKTVTVSGNKFIDRFQPIEITCNATGHREPPRDVTWFRDDVPLEANVTHGIEISTQIESQTLISRLTIRRSELTDSGHYVCRSSSNEAAGISIHVLGDKCAHDAYRVIISKPAVTVSGNKFIERFQPIEITCNATGKHEAPHDVNWFRNGVPLESSVTRGIEISKEIEPQTLISRLTIKRSELADSGHYVCRSSSNEAAVINIQILDVSNSNVKRESEQEQTGAQLMEGAAVTQTLHSVMFLAALSCVIAHNTRWHWR